MSTYTNEQIEAQLLLAEELTATDESRLQRTQWEGRKPDDWEVQLSRRVENRGALVAIITQLRAENAHHLRENYKALRYGTPPLGASRVCQETPVGSGVHGGKCSNGAKFFCDHCKICMCGKHANIHRCKENVDA